MSETKHTHHSHPGPERGRMDLEHRPYWKRAHHDWRFWAGLFLMFAAITIYVMSDDLAFLSSSQPRQAASNAVRK
ncbi:MAG: hypothetical protein WA755_03330 [Candidatus Acidiferrales bacterium]